MEYKFYNGRFFINPIVGCKGKCIYCYLSSEMDNKNIVRKNRLEVERIVRDITADKNYIQGKKGSIISIGSHGDIFPKEDYAMCKYSSQFINRILEVGNPVQIISKNSLSEDLIENIVTGIQYKNQLLFSTTITSFIYYSKLEVGTSSPKDRLKTAKKFHTYGIPTNVMIKPFLKGITDKETRLFVKEFTENCVKYAVVGDLHIIDDVILSKINNYIDNQDLEDTNNMETLDCTENTKYRTIKVEHKDLFIQELRNAGVRTYLKSSCVNSNILGIKNVSYQYNLENNYCVKCGQCL